ncbi:hypothetical protein WSM22_35020 [Cytophagales bacterium WSM2-2]|nr:hypothetical protein WSM22_35020 [Cytophagales bacterium WSM2-2]
MSDKKKQTRRNFIGTLAVSGAAGLSLISNPLKANFLTSDEKATSFADPEIAADAESWLKTLQGKKFPVVYDMHEHKDFWAGIWSNIYFMTNAGVSDIGVAVVMRHGGFPFALNDSMWSKYKLGEFFKVNDKNTGAPTVRNMYWEPTGKDYPLPGLDGIKALQQKGVGFCVCNMALKVYSGVIAGANGLTADAVYNDFVANILPGVQTVPSGVWALGRFQQAPLSYGYINAG